MFERDNPYPGFLEIFWGDEFAFMVAASPIGIDLAVLSGPPALGRAALPLLMLVQAVLVVADRWRLERMFPGRAVTPPLAWALFAPGYLFQRARALAHLRYAPLVWLLTLLVMLLPFFMLMFDPRDHGAAAASCDRPAARVQSETARRPPPGQPIDWRDDLRGAEASRVTHRSPHGVCGR